MKKLIFFTCLLITCDLVLAQPAKKPAVKPVAPKPLLKNLNDSVSYAIGLSVANFYKQQGVNNMSTSLIAKAINDVYGKKPTLMNDQAANACMNKLMMQIQEDKAKPAVEAGKVFLENNKKRPEVKTTPSGLQYEVIREGTGIKPAAADTFVCNYRGTLLNGTEFDDSYKRGQPLILPVTSVIRGWTEGLQLMTVGSKYKFYIPYDLGYGLFENPPIPGGSTLIFEVELLDVKKHQ
ncbi:MAG: FKBP-type peptidyl-prolyl cis-trans isomerase [Bacteroidota bacterium]|nr:FKBP-type peptidyl-prolyl cis-trans isomerase [Bacteroidota bacterium]